MTGARGVAAGLAIALVAFAAVALPALAAGADTMSRIVIRDVSAGLPANHFGRLPKIVYRAGTCCVRLEEQRNPENGLRLVFITRDPDTWVLDLDQMLGGHTVSDGSKPGAHLPVLWTDGLDGLEFGQELAFMKEKGAKRDGPVNCGSGKCARQTLEHNGYKVVLLTTAEREVPAEISVSTPSGEQLAFAYDAYETGLAMKPELFSLPQGARLMKAPQAEPQQ